MLTALPKEVQERVMNFLVPFLPRPGHECPVIATGVASRNHRVWKIAGYHWWNLRAAQLVENFIVRINNKNVGSGLSFVYGTGGLIEGRGTSTVSSVGTSQGSRNYKFPAMAEDL